MKLSRTLRFSMIIVVLFAFAFTLSALDQKLSAEGKKNLNSAKIHFSGGRFDKALPLYESVLAENPNHIEANVKANAIIFEIDNMYVEAYKRSGLIIGLIDQIYEEHEELESNDKKAAKKFFKKEIKKPGLEEKRKNSVIVGKNCWTLLYKDSYENYKAEDYATSNRKYLELLEMAPDSVKTLKMVANTYLRMDDSENTIKYLTMSLEKDPEDYKSIQLLATLYYQDANFEGAIAEYQKMAVLDPENSSIYFNIGVTYFTDIKDYEKALENFQKSYKLDNSNIDALYNILAVAVQTQNEDLQISTRKQLIIADPADSDNYIALGSLLYKAKKFQELLDFSETMIDVDPDMAEQFKNLANSNLNK